MDKNKLDQSNGGYTSMDETLKALKDTNKVMDGVNDTLDKSLTSMKASKTHLTGYSFTLAVALCFLALGYFLGRHDERPRVTVDHPPNRLSGLQEIPMIPRLEPTPLTLESLSHRIDELNQRVEDVEARPSTDRFRQQLLTSIRRVPFVPFTITLKNGPPLRVDAPEQLTVGDNVFGYPFNAVGYPAGQGIQQERLSQIVRIDTAAQEPPVAQPSP